jgi:hypothetical protein
VPQQLLWGIQWIIVPGILALFLLTGLYLPFTGIDERTRRSGYSGILAGAIIFVIFVVSQQKQRYRSLSFEMMDFQFSPISLALGGVIGFVAQFIFELVEDNIGMGLLALIITSATLIAAFGYFFVVESKDTILFLSLGILLGVFLHRIVRPGK